MKLLDAKARGRQPRQPDVQGAPTQHREGRLINLSTNFTPDVQGWFHDFLEFI